jgi:hypothetical protein
MLKSVYWDWLGNFLSGQLKVGAPQNMCNECLYSNHTGMVVAALQLIDTLGPVGPLLDHVVGKQRHATGCPYKTWVVRFTRQAVLVVPHLPLYWFPRVGCEATMHIEEVAKVSRRMLPHLKMGVIQGLI